MSETTLEKIVALAKNRGFVYSGSEIYGGLANAWDYGPLGVELKNNVKKAWWEKFVRESEATKPFTVKTPNQKNAPVICLTPSNRERRCFRSDFSPDFSISSQPTANSESLT